MDEVNILEILGKNIHDIRFEKNISLRELANKSKIDIETLKNFEAGEGTLEIWQYSDIATALNVDMKDITKGIQFVED